MLALEPALSLRDRHAGMVLGSFAGDSLALAPHWIYDQGEIADRFGACIDLEAAPAGGYHSGKALGAQTHYGDQALVLLDSLNAMGGQFVVEDFAQRWRNFWDDSCAYRDHATKETLAHLASGLPVSRAGSDSGELGGASRIAPLLAALRNEDAPTLIAAVRAQTALTHNTPAVIDAAEFLARVSSLLLRGVRISSALRSAAMQPYRALTAEKYLSMADEVSHLSTLEAVEELGQSCALEKALPACFAILLRHGQDPETALIENVRAGGDSAARAMVLGLLLGTAHGGRSIPPRWTEPLKARDHIDRFLKTIGLGNPATNYSVG